MTLKAKSRDRFSSACRLSLGIALTSVLIFSFAPRSSRASSLKIGYGALSLGYALIWVTKEGKIFDKNGLDVDVLYLESNLVRTG